MGRWWAAEPRDDWGVDDAEGAEIEKEFEGEYGDRRQELVFIGLFTDEAAENLRHSLGTCLLSDGELAKGATTWRRWVDPFDPEVPA